MDCKECRRQILGMGNALTDIPVVLPDRSLLKRMGFPAGSMTHIGARREREIWSKLQDMELQCIPGGSAANTVVAAVQLGMGGGFIGKVGPDGPGKGFAAGMERYGVCANLLEGTVPSGKAFTFITPPDRERTFATFLGAALEFVPDELNEEMFCGYDYLHVEGYLLQCPGVVEKAMEMAKKSGMTISFDLGSAGTVKKYHHTIARLVHDYADIVFANEQEAEAFAGVSAAEALGVLADSMGEKGIAVVKLGASGSLVQRGDEHYEIAPVPAAVVDTTGAGDAYAAGFIHAHSMGADIRSCGEAGSLLASKVVAVVGPKIFGGK